LTNFVRNAPSFGYGLIAQTCSSATNFGLVVIAGHVLGPSGLGTLLIGFAAYILLLGFLRALVTDPLVASSSGHDAAKRASSARAALTLALFTSAAIAGVLTVFGILVPTRIGHGMLLFAPWLVPALVQDLGRSIVFRDRAGRRSAVLSDTTWLVTMALAAPLAFVWGSDWAVVACWGIGALFGALVALSQVRWGPVSLPQALSWWRVDARRLARWLGAQALLYNIASYATVLLLAGILGSGDYGGFRAVQSVFAPLTLLGPALALPGLPLVSRLVVDAPRHALGVAAQIAGLITVVTGVYVAAFWAIPGVLAFFFGQDFTDFQTLIVPIGLAQVLAAPAFGLTLYLKAKQRGATLLWLGTLNALVYLVLTVALGSVSGVSGAAWGAVGTGAVSVVALMFVFRRSAWPSSHGATR
jgi:O-antigen/teichoic acid export membrane protein